MKRGISLDNCKSAFGVIFEGNRSARPHIPKNSGLFLRQSKAGLSSSAFSLIEVLISLSVFAIGSVSILGLMAVVLQTSKESWQETRSTQIVRQIMNDLGSGTRTDGYLVVGTNYSESDSIQKVALAKLTQTYSKVVWYDAEGHPVGVGDNAPDASARYEAQVIIGPDNGRNNLNYVQIRIVPNASSVSAFSSSSVAAVSGGSSTGSESEHLSTPKGCLTFFSKIASPESASSTASANGSVAITK